MIDDFRVYLERHASSERRDGSRSFPDVLQLRLPLFRVPDDLHRFFFIHFTVLRVQHVHGGRHHAGYEV